MYHLFKDAENGFLAPYMHQLWIRADLSVRKQIFCLKAMKTHASRGGAITGTVQSEPEKQLFIAKLEAISIANEIAGVHVDLRRLVRHSLPISSLVSMTEVQPKLDHLAQCIPREHLEGAMAFIAASSELRQLYILPSHDRTEGPPPSVSRDRYLTAC